MMDWDREFSAATWYVVAGTGNNITLRLFAWERELYPADPIVELRKPIHSNLRAAYVRAILRIDRQDDDLAWCGEMWGSLDGPEQASFGMPWTPQTPEAWKDGLAGPSVRDWKAAGRASRAHYLNKIIAQDAPAPVAETPEKMLEAGGLLKPRIERFVSGEIVRGRTAETGPSLADPKYAAAALEQVREKLRHGPCPRCTTLAKPERRWDYAHFGGRFMTACPSCGCER